ncbi:MAG: hypothetical protein M3409_01180 [Gemmatimonadota bacterium]|jgi:hypothetical protein|nr:hypothetical protein [Gemmatimonadota bacterium]
MWFHLAGFAGLAILAAIGGVLHRRSIRRVTRRRPSILSDRMIREIETRGAVDWEPDEPLDTGRISEEEERFWRDAAWDEPEQL